MRTLIAARAILVSGAHVAAGALLVEGEDVTKDEADRLLADGNCTIFDGEAEAAARILADMTVAELKALAEAEGIDLGTAGKKAEIVEAIEKARAAAANA